MTGKAQRTRVATALVAVGACIAALGLMAPIATAADAGTTNYLYKDKFDSGDYNGNDGSRDFWGPWSEYGDRGDAGDGAVSVQSGNWCQSEFCARIAGDGEDVSGIGLARWADLEGAVTARIKFKFSQEVDAGEGGVNVAVNAGSSWHNIFQIPFDPTSTGIQTKTIGVTQFATGDFAIGFFAYGHLDGAVFIDDVSIFGAWESITTTTTTTTTTPTSTTLPSPPTTVTPTTVAPTTTTSPPPTIPVPTTTDPSTPITTTSTAPVVSQPPATTTQQPAVLPPIENDSRYILKAELANHLILANSIMELPTASDEIPEPSPVTQIMASVTTTAVTVRSHLLSASVLGLLIAIGAVWGLGRREPAVTPAREPSSP